MIRNFVYVFFIGLMVSCATQVPPSGGEIDKTPPVPLNFKPTQGSKNIQSRTKVSIAFDEYFTLDRLSEQMVVSPPMIQNPKVSIHGKKIEFLIPDSLRENTTYTIYFGESIKNIKENLAAQNFFYSFSTGDYVDSMEISGSVLDAFSLKPSENVIVILYKDTCDTVGLYQRPYYLAKSKTDGAFQLKNLAPGNYRIFVIRDLNSNYILDQEDEECAFLNNNVESQVVIHYADTIPDSLRVKPTTYNLFLFKGIAKKQSIVNSTVLAEYKLQTIFKRPLNNLKINALNVKNMEVYNKLSLNKDSVISYIKNVDKDTLILQISDNEVVIDTVKYFLGKVRKQLDSSWMKNYLPKAILSGQQSFFKPLNIEFPFPILEGDLSKVKIVKLTDNNELEVKSEAKWLDDFPYNFLSLQCKFEERQKYKVSIPMGSFKNIYGMYNDTFNYIFTTNQAREFGSLVMDISGLKNRNIILQILQSNDKIVEVVNIHSDTNITFKYIPAGAYKLKAIIDENKNGKWDTGEYSESKLPEKVFYLKDIINIRNNWDINWKWILE